MAIGICVITKRAICAECSTQYKGVNYSKEGLEILLEQERSQEEKVGWLTRVAIVLLVAGAPLGLAVVYWTVKWTGQGIIDVFQFELPI